MKLVGLIRKRAELSADEFAAHWLGTHAELARRLPGLRRYTVNIIDRERFPNAAYDGFSELWFDSAEALDAALSSSIGAEIAADIPKFMAELVRVIVDEHQIIEPPPAA